MTVYDYANRDHAAVAAEARASAQVSKAYLAEKHTPVRVSARSNAKLAGKLAYSAKEYDFLRKHYKSNAPQAIGALSQADLRELHRWIEFQNAGTRDSHKLMPVIKDVIYGKVLAVENRLDEGLNPNATILMGYPFDSNFTLLDIAIRAGQRGIIKVLLAHDASVNSSDGLAVHGTSRFEGPLAVAAKYGEDDVIRELLKRGVNVNQKSGLKSDSTSALSQALYTGNVATVYLLLTHGANIDSVLGPGGTVPAFLYKFCPPPRIPARRPPRRHAHHA